MALVELFGETLVTKDGPKPTAEALSGCTQIGVYFSAHWCPPCRAFTPKLADKFKHDYAAKGLKVVFVSADRHEKDFNEYYGEMPWHALPYGCDRGKALGSRYDVEDIPMLVILDPQGNMLSKDGRILVSQGMTYPWSLGAHADAGRPSSVPSSVARAFSAHWCPPCRAFTPKLAEKFKNDYEAKGLKVVFVSSDRNEQGFNEYYGEMPWHALPYGSDRKETLSRKYGVQGIPMFVILDPEGNLLSADGRGLVSQGAAYPWSPGGGAGAGAGAGAPPSSGCAVL
eukprot:CAMPEP_0198606234 /NCGR_PEP_ID=MMETSP1462-20131121/154794_1 /TAXON_ID=1333877 /ORGANISM="Brandtodinium nutriculum, Strain RCC3387" /LENGTH=283 /DNA_ID=CAMNT_0044338037 /DNA_START=75 /DNA_END=926 /DNA_ORIENTATION=+